MYANKMVLAVMLGLGMAGTVLAQTIEEITNLHRLKVVKELRDKTIGAEKSTPSFGSMPSMPGAIPGLLPPGQAAPAIVPAKREPMLMGIYGVGSSLVAELEEDGYTSQYRQGDVTAGGWTVLRIDGKRVDLAKGKGKKPKTVALTFGSKVDVPKEATSSPVPGMMPPPMPGMIPPGGIMPASMSMR